MSAGTPQAAIDWELRLGFLIHDVSRLRRSAFDRCLKPLNMTRSQWWVLAYLSREDGMTQSQLATELDMGKVALGGLIDRLEKSGLLRRQADASDRRVNRVFLEPKSKQLVARLRKISHGMNRAILQGLDDHQRECAATTLIAMKRNLRRFLDGSEP